MLEAELEVAIEVARQAGRIVMEVYAKDFEVEFKGESSPVTEADKRANAFIVGELARHFPTDGIVAEENEDHGDALSRSRRWYVDPLDGTKEFIAKNGEFAVMIGLSVDDRSRLGVVYRPSEDLLYQGVIGQGAYLEQSGERQPLEVSDEAVASELSLVVSRSHRDKSIDTLVERLGITKEAPSGSVGLKIGRIAQRTADLYVHVSDKACAWDACGPEAIVRAAGGRFTDLGGDPFVYAGEDMNNRRGILACNSAAFDAVLPVVREVGREAGYL